MEEMTGTVEEVAQEDVSGAVQTRELESVDGDVQSPFYHPSLNGLDVENQHPMAAITGLVAALAGKQPAGSYATSSQLQAETTARQQADANLQAQISQIDTSHFATKTEINTEKSTRETADNNLQNQISQKMPLSTKYGKSIEMSMNSSTYVMTLKLKDQDGNQLGETQTVDLPLETVVVSGRYDSATKKVILTLKDGSEISFSVADLVSGLQKEITSTNRLSSDLVDDTDKTHKFVSESEKTAWSDKANKDLDNLSATGEAKFVKPTDYASTSAYGVLKIGIGSRDTGVLIIENGALGINKATNSYSLTIGGNASTTIASTNIGYNSSAFGWGSSAFGSDAQVGTNENRVVGAIQIGRGQNTEAGSLYIGLSTNGSTWNNYKLLGSDGKIPTDRTTAVDDSSTTSTTLGWSASKLNTTIGNIESALLALRGNV